MEVSSPATLAEALEELAAFPETVVLAGGTDLLVAINFGRERPERVMSLRRLQELGELDHDRLVRCGARVTYTRMLAELSDPVMRQAARTVGSPQIRNAGTLGGNLGTCSPAGDTLPALAALDATVVLASPAGERRVPLTQFMRGPKRPDRRPDELVLGAEWLPAGVTQAFLKAGTRNAMVIAVANCALVVDPVRRRVGVGLGSVGPVILRAAQAESFAAGLLEERDWVLPATLPESAIVEFGRLASSAAQPIDDVRGTAAYRRHLVAVMARRALERVCASA
ncbi:MAG TPA: FAD binding domain-containing protein [Candidatus Dormibacteraeota bacterium]